MARAALGEVIETYSPPGAHKVALAATAIAGSFSDTVCALSNAPDIVTVINAQLAGAGSPPSSRGRGRPADLSLAERTKISYIGGAPRRSPPIPTARARFLGTGAETT